MPSPPSLQQLFHVKRPICRASCRRRRRASTARMLDGRSMPWRARASATSSRNVACGVSVTADDLEAINGYVASMTAPIVAPATDEPARNTDSETAAISETNAMIDQMLAKAKSTSRGAAAINGAAK